MTSSIRPERPGDVDAIWSVTERAFRDADVPGERTEAYIVDALRDAGALTLSLVADDDGAVVGHVAFSPVTVSDGTNGWFILGPVSVLPERQGHGVGSALIRAGLAAMRAAGARGCLLVGHPGYYPRFGFVHPTNGLVYPGVPDDAFFVLPFDGAVPSGDVHVHEAFEITRPADADRA
ncbi:MAG: N-acetyltransferase [Promicromonosporaceae bacterium]|nr:N-acetyltransferase [Promicromonosporaceae bacterium]